MILMYHKVDIVTPTIWWITPQDLDRQICSLKQHKFVYLEDYKNPENEVVITFDDGYENIFHHAFPILKAYSIPFEIFVSGDVIGDWNDFDPGEPKTRFMSKNQLLEIAEGGGRIQWHTRTHPNLPDLTDEEITWEMTVSDELRRSFPPPHFSWFSYPYGAHDERAITIARQLFSGAVSVIDGLPEDKWQLNRITVDQYTSFDTPWLDQLDKLENDKQ